MPPRSSRLWWGVSTEVGLSAPLRSLIDFPARWSYPSTTSPTLLSSSWDRLFGRTATTFLALRALQASSPPKLPLPSQLAQGHAPSRSSRTSNKVLAHLLWRAHRNQNRNFSKICGAASFRPRFPRPYAHRAHYAEYSTAAHASLAHSQHSPARLQPPCCSSHAP